MVNLQLLMVVTQTGLSLSAMQSVEEEPWLARETAPILHLIYVERLALGQLKRLLHATKKNALVSQSSAQ